MMHPNDRQRGTLARLTTAAGAFAAALLTIFTLAGGAGAAQPPTVLMGVAGQFAVLAGSGITNTGTTTISGDTGSSQPLATETGFAGCPAANCVTQTGTNHTQPEPNDQTTQDAKTALRTAYGDAAGRSPSTVVTELGGQTLVGGVYSSASGTFGMTGTLTLDGQGNADSVFIFQTASTLITGGAGNVVLENGAQACNIFWKVGSSATLGGGSTFRGTILANTDISVGGAVTVDGRLLAGEQPSGSGAVTLINDTIATPSTCVTQASIDSAAAAAQAAAAQAAAAAAAAQAAAAQAAAASLAAAQALQAANATAAAAAVATAAHAAAVASAKAAAAKQAAARAATAAKLAKVAKAKASAAKAAAAAKLAAAKASAAKAAAARAATAAKAAAAKVAAAKAMTSSSIQAKPTTSRAGFTG